MSQSELRDLFKVRMYMRFVAARFFGGTASQMLMVAVAWQMYDLTGSAWDLGLVGLRRDCGCGRTLDRDLDWALLRAWTLAVA